MYPNLKLQIFKFGLHQNRIAKALGIDESVLSKIIHGFREPSESQRKQLAAFLKVEENWLFEKYDAFRDNRAHVPGASAEGADDRFHLSKPPNAG
jgi:transcriptional regulator with XRE-family HTH domain